MKSYAEEGSLQPFISLSLSGVDTSTTDPVEFPVPGRNFQRVTFVIDAATVTVASLAAVEAVVQNATSSFYAIVLHRVYYRPPGGVLEAREVPTAEYEFVNGETGRYMIEVDASQLNNIRDPQGNRLRDADRIALRFATQAGDTLTASMASVQYNAATIGEGTEQAEALLSLLRVTGTSEQRITSTGDERIARVPA